MSGMILNAPLRNYYNACTYDTISDSNNTHLFLYGKVTQILFTLRHLRHKYYEKSEMFRTYSLIL